MTSRRALRTAILSAATCVLLLTQVAVSEPADLFTTEDGAVSFWAPLPPKKSTTGIPDNGVEFPRTQYTMRAPGYMLRASILDLVDITTTGDERVYLNTYVDQLLAGLGPDFVVDKVDGRTDLPPGPIGLQGIRIRGVKGIVEAVMRVYIGTCHIYIFEILHEGGSKVTTPLGERFFSSATVNDGVFTSCVVSPH